MTDLDEIMSRGGEAMPAPQEQPTQQQAPEAPAEPQPAPQPQEPPQQPQEDPNGAMVPRAALEAERGKARSYKEELAAVRQQFEGFQQQFQGFVQAFQAQAQPRPQPQPPQPAPDFMQDPDGYFDHRFQANVKQAVDPIREQLVFNARLVAESIHKPETVKEAQEAFDRAIAMGQIDPRDYQRVMQSPNPFHEAVGWHRRTQALSRYGDDPDGFIEAEVARRLAERAPPTQQPGAPAAPMPSSFAAAPSQGPRTAPQYSGPKPLSEIMGR